MRCPRRGAGDVPQTRGWRRAPVSTWRIRGEYLLSVGCYFVFKCTEQLESESVCPGVLVRRARRSLRLHAPHTGSWWSSLSRWGLAWVAHSQFVARHYTYSTSTYTANLPVLTLHFTLATEWENGNYELGYQCR